MDQKVKTLLIVILLILIAIPLILFGLSTGTELRVEPPVTTIGQETPVRVLVTNPHDLRELKVVIEQNGKQNTVLDDKQPSRRFTFWRKRYGSHEILLKIGKNQAPALREGKARVILAATSNDFRGKIDETSFDVNVVTTPPRVSADGEQHYVNQGGSELVVFTPAGYVTDSGVRVGRYQFRSFPMSSDAKRRFSLFAYPWDLPATERPRVFATNPAGAVTTAEFWFKLFPKKFRARDIEITDAFLEKVVTQIEQATHTVSTGEMLPRFLKINREMRVKNNQALADLRLQSEPKLLWSGPFQQLGNSQVEAAFADKRSYIYKGKKVDEQVHLGFDLAVTSHTPIPASNDGRILWADDMGIYGNCIVIDHGYGLQAIYGHLSEFLVKKGDMVKKGQIIGKSGSTGLAGGDHLHYTMQVDGVQVNPVEWWDAHWIHDRILSKLN